MQSCSLFSWTLILALYLEAHLNRHKGKHETLFFHKNDYRTGRTNDDFAEEGLVCSL